jgi:sugar phosphate isomerase/epimerase
MRELLEHTNKIKFVHDTYWTAKCGISPALQIKEFEGRLLGIHLRDLTFKKRGLDVKGADAAIGDGVIDFSSVLDAAEKASCRYLVIEQNTRDPYQEIEKSLNTLLDIRKE